jgi:ElaB/YqjD/DUF883 family membrane-anchored ribosome-binding protein
VYVDAHPRGSFEGKTMATTTKSTSAKTAKPKAAPRKKPATKAASSASNGAARAKFTKAIEEAKAGAQALTKEAQAKAGAYKEQLSAKSGDWIEDAKVYADQAKAKATELAIDGKARASDAIAGLGKAVSDNADTIDEKLGTRYGDYARSAARSMQETAAKLEAKELGELGEDAKEFVRKSPGVAIGLAAVAGFLLARLFKGSSDN